ncbi:hypothetical protein UK12_34145, partial [Saccharothrix sp. ST-888]
SYSALDRRLPVLADSRKTKSEEEAPQVPSRTSRTSPRGYAGTPVLTYQVVPIAEETLSAYRARIAQANHLTVTEVLAVLPSWFSTKTSNLDDRALHHMLVPAATHALHELAHLT